MSGSNVPTRNNNKGGKNQLLKKNNHNTGYSQQTPSLTRNNNKGGKNEDDLASKTFGFYFSPFKILFSLINTFCILPKINYETTTVCKITNETEPTNSILDCNSTSYLRNHTLIFEPSVPFGKFGVAYRSSNSGLSLYACINFVDEIFNLTNYLKSSCTVLSLPAVDKVSQFSQWTSFAILCELINCNDYWKSLHILFC